MPIPVDSGWIPVESGLIPVDSSGFQWNPVIPAGMVGGVTSTGKTPMRIYGELSGSGEQRGPSLTQD